MRQNILLNQAVHLLDQTILPAESDSNSAESGSSFCWIRLYILLNETEHSAESGSTFCGISYSLQNQTVQSDEIDNLLC